MFWGSLPSSGSGWMFGEAGKCWVEGAGGGFFPHFLYTYDNMKRYIYISLHEANVNLVMEPHVSLVQFAESVHGGDMPNTVVWDTNKNKREKMCTKGLRHVNSRPCIGLLIAGGGLTVSLLCRFLSCFPGDPVWVWGWGGALEFSGWQPLDQPSIPHSNDAFRQVLAPDFSFSQWLLHGRIQILEGGGVTYWRVIGQSSKWHSHFVQFQTVKTRNGWSKL